MFRAALIFTLISITSASAGPLMMYVSVSGEKKIAVYEMDSKTGGLTQKGTISAVGAPGSLVISPDGKYLYAALRSTRRVASYAIDPKTGGLKQLGMTQVLGGATYVTTDQTGKFLLTAYYGLGKAAIYPISNGVVHKVPSQLIVTGKNPHSILLDKDNSHGYIPCTGADYILQFQWDAAEGKLKPLATDRVKTKAGAGPRHFRFDPRPESDQVYVVNEKNSSVTVYRQHPKSGELTSVQQIPTLPKDFTNRNTCADIELTSTGRYLCASNRGHDSLACYSVDAKTGKLTALGQQATEKTPREFAIAPGDQFVVAAGQRSGKLATYRINKDGKLKALKIYAIGKGPSWVLFHQCP